MEEDWKEFKPFARGQAEFKEKFISLLRDQAKALFPLVERFKGTA